jgi:hypothetical protein
MRGFESMRRRTRFAISARLYAMLSPGFFGH